MPRDKGAGRRNRQHDRCGFCYECQDGFIAPPNKHWQFRPGRTEAGRSDVEDCIYAHDDIPRGFIELFANKRKNQLRQTQVKACERWQGWYPNVVGYLPRQRDFDLSIPFEIFDDYFFCGALWNPCRLYWKNQRAMPGALGQTFDKGDCSEIWISRLTGHARGERWTERSLQDILDTLLHGMCHAAFQIFGCNCSDCFCYDNLIGTSGITGHGPSYVQLCKAIEREANRTFGDLGERWNLDV